jgi:putative phosphoesterase
MSVARPVRIGLISDTHGLLRPAVLAYLAGCDHLIHAGDVGDAAIIDTLAAIAPLTVVRGNNDLGGWAQALPERVTVDIGAVRVHVLHDLAELDLRQAGDGVRLVVSGHSHQPKLRTEDGVLYVNPGAAGPRRFRLPIAAAQVWVREGRLEAQIQEFPPAG